MSDEVCKIAAGAAVYVVLCKAIYNTLLARDGEELSDLTITKTVILGVIAISVMQYVYTRVQSTPIPFSNLSWRPTNTAADSDDAVTPKPFRKMQITHVVPRSSS